MRRPGSTDSRHDQWKIDHVAHASPGPSGFRGPRGSAPRTSSSSPAVADPDARLLLEDKIRHVIDSWTEEEKATAYWYLFASGMTVEKAKTVRRRAGFVT
jgi:hypothetical protein